MAKNTTEELWNYAKYHLEKDSFKIHYPGKFPKSFTKKLIDYSLREIIIFS